jgi:hypothetical protein
VAWLLKAGLTVIAAAVLAVASAWALTGPDAVGLPIANGPWRTSAKLGNSGDGLYVRAAYARIAWFSNDPDRSIYYEARADSAGRILTLRCAYRLSGGPLPARWWSLTAYRNFHWIPNPQNRYSFTRTNIASRPDGSWEIDARPAASGQNWLPTRGQGRLSFVMRLYDPTPEAMARREAITLPRIERAACT